ncbi:hypothetical protein M408DRAFT_9468 [Serendipita vermifera MAFF 305830]|uniref:Uncharacterized protein n=1 Tax=Serendipita vermifera MAFF 305830 TaxID=933852 RepID=A0A0C2XDA1_SERVB|nr:hypothetical protein M408DRAFT_9468 [Serendipita vermifera MAFF 305830]
MPNLVKLDIDFEHGHLLSHLLVCKGFYPGNLHTVSLGWNAPRLVTDRDVLRVTASLLDLLSRASNLATIFSQGDMLSLLLKAIWQAEYRRNRGGDETSPKENEVTRPLIRNTVLVNRPKLEKLYLTGNETMADLEGVAKSWNLIPVDMTLEDYVERLRVIGRRALLIGWGTKAGQPSPMTLDEASEVDANDEECPCRPTTRACVERSLCLLAGDGGLLCSRWRHLRLDLDHDANAIGGEKLANSMTYPTPKLTHLSLNNLSFDETTTFPPLFPDTPLLRTFSVVDCQLPSFPNLNTIKDMQVGWKESEEFQDLPVLRTATQVQTLELHVPFFADIPLPAHMPDLCYLTIHGNNFPADLYQCDMPNLWALDIDFEHENLLAHLVRCKGFYPGNLRVVYFSWNVPLFVAVGDVLSVIASLLDFLPRASNLAYIFSEGDMLSLLLKVIWQAEYRRNGGGDRTVPEEDELTQPLVRNVLIVNRPTHENLYLTGNETTAKLEDVAKSWNLIPMDMTIEDYVKRLQLQQFRDLPVLATCAGFEATEKRTKHDVPGSARARLHGWLLE